MRTKEQFKSYVYEKAEAKKAENKRMRNLWLRSVATCSLLIIIGIVALYGGLGVNNVSEDFAPANAIPEAKKAQGTTYLYSATFDGSVECETEMCMDNASVSGYVAADTGFDVLELAKKECTVEYDAYTVEYDEAEELWKVVFYTEGAAGGDQTVYIDNDGVTVKIVYGE